MTLLRWLRRLRAPLTPNRRSGFVPRLDALGAVEGELRARGSVLRHHGLEQEGVMVARVEGLDDPAHEPVAAALDDRRALGPLVPVHLRELVDLVPGLAAEQLGEVVRVGRDEVHGERARPAGDAEGPVLVRQARQEARWVDRGLRPEPDQAARALAAGRRR